MLCVRRWVPPKKGFAQMAVLTSASAQDIARPAWERDLRAIGHDPVGYQAEILRFRQEFDATLIVLRLDNPAGPSFVFKQDFLLKSDEAFQKMAQNQGRAGDLFADQPGLHVPPLLCISQADRSMLMPFVQGHSAHDCLLLDGTPENRHVVLHSCGQWIGHLHRSTMVRKSAVKPDKMQAYLAMLRDQVMQRKSLVPARRLFLETADKAIEFAESVRGQTTSIAMFHNDMKLTNLMIGPDGVSGFGFDGARTGPVGHDLARFFTNFATYFYPDKNVAKAGDWLGRDFVSFFQGYGRDCLDDPSLAYLLRMRVLQDWIKVPQQTTRRSLDQQRRWQGLRHLTKILF